MKKKAARKSVAKKCKTRKPCAKKKCCKKVAKKTGISNAQKMRNLERLAAAQVVLTSGDIAVIDSAAASPAAAALIALADAPFHVDPVAPDPFINDEGHEADILEAL